MRCSTDSLFDRTLDVGRMRRGAKSSYSVECRRRGASKRWTSSSVFQTVRTPNFCVLVPDGPAKTTFLSVRRRGSSVKPGAPTRRVHPSVGVAGKGECTGKGVVEEFGRAAKSRFVR